MARILSLALALMLGLSACSTNRVGDLGDPVAKTAPLPQPAEALLAGESMAVAYSGYREGQHPDRGDGEMAPTPEQILEDLQILSDHGFSLIRLYDAGANSTRVLEVIREHQLPFTVLLGAWLDAELSNHEGCPWLEVPIPQHTLEANRDKNQRELQRLIELAGEYRDIVVAVNVGNEALVSWTDHLVPVERVISYVQRVRAAIEQPVTVAENYAWWIESGSALAAAVDFLGVHSYPIWEDRDIDQGLSHTVENIEAVMRAHPGHTAAVLEAGWATTAEEFGERASETRQLRYFTEMEAWAAASNVTVFFFEAFDEPWKGDPNSPKGAEKHWGLFTVDRAPKAAMAGRRGPAEWELVWQDEFNDPAGTPPNPDHWSYQLGDGSRYELPGWGNEELQYYTDDPANAATDGEGNLLITVREADGSLECYYGPCLYTSARLSTQEKVEVEYGRIEARVKLPAGSGVWSAFWSLGTDIREVGWPETGEIDIMEFVGRDPNTVFGTLHGPGHAGNDSYGDTLEFDQPLYGEYHVFRVDWWPDRVEWYVDDRLYHTATAADLPGKWAYNDPVFLLLNVAMGGHFGGDVEPGLSLPLSLAVDYVRVYRQLP